MSETLTPKELATAAAQGVAIALNARKQHKENRAWIPPRIICGDPTVLYEISFKADGESITTVDVTQVKAG